MSLGKDRSCLAKSSPACCEMFSSDMFCPLFLAHFPAGPLLPLLPLPLLPLPALRGMFQHWGGCIKGKYGMFTERIFKKC